MGGVSMNPWGGNSGVEGFGEVISKNSGQQRTYRSPSTEKRIEEIRKKFEENQLKETETEAELRARNKELEAENQRLREENERLKEEGENSSEFSNSGLSGLGGTNPVKRVQDWLGALKGYNRTPGYAW